MNKNELFELLETTKSETNKFYDLPESDLIKTYGTDKWSIREILHHLADTEMIFIGRLKTIIAEPKQVIWAFNQDDWNEIFDYKNQSLEGKKEIFMLCRNINYQLTERFYDEHHKKTFVHSETGLRTLQDEFEKVALHNQGHIDQIKLALSK